MSFGRLLHAQFHLIPIQQKRFGAVPFISLQWNIIITLAIGPPDFTPLCSRRWAKFHFSAQMAVIVSVAVAVSDVDESPQLE